MESLAWYEYRIEQCRKLIRTCEKEIEEYESDKANLKSLNDRVVNVENTMKSSFNQPFTDARSDLTEGNSGNRISGYLAQHNNILEIVNGNDFCDFKNVLKQCEECITDAEKQIKKRNIQISGARSDISYYNRCIKDLVTQETE